MRVNGKLETNVPGIWALGDVKGGPAFTHISYNDYQIVYGNLIEGKNLSIEHRIVPYCMFTDPELGSVGLTEKEARAKGYKLKIGTVPMSRVSRAIERDETAGLMKLIVDASNDRILGLHDPLYCRRRNRACPLHAHAGWPTLYFAEGRWRDFHPSDVRGGAVFPRERGAAGGLKNSPTRAARYASKPLKIDK